MMSQTIVMPALSDTMTSGQLMTWQKQIGDEVHKGDVLAEIETDKAVMDLEAFADGYLSGPLAEPGQDIPVGQVIGYLMETAGEISAQTTGIPPTGITEQPLPQDESRPVAVSVTTPPPPAPQAEAVEALPITESRGSIPAASTPGKSSPYARGLARELGVDLHLVKPGPDGRIHAREVIDAARQPLPDLDAGPPWRLQLFTKVHEAVARNLAATTATPTFHVSARLPLAPLHDLAHQQQLSLSLLLARACALAISEFPHLNASWTPWGLALRQRVDVGIAVDVPGGLMTPVLRDAAKRPLTELAEDWRLLKDKAKRRRLAPQDYQGATFYLSNLGMFPVVQRFDAVIPLGAAAILAVGARQDDGLAECTLSCDHRVLFGAEAARFLTHLSELLDQPQAWLEFPDNK